MWSRRAQEYDQKINSGKIYELAEVVKDLNKNTDIIADQSYSERQLFEKAYERLKSEFEAVLKVSPEEVQKKMDKALGRTKISEEAENKKTPFLKKIKKGRLVKEKTIFFFFSFLLSF